MANSAAAVMVVLATASAALGQEFQWIPAPSGLAWLQASGVSADGSVVVGWGYNAISGRRVAFAWDNMRGIRWLSDPQQGYDSTYAYAANADGSVVVGYREELSHSAAFRWTESGGLSLLPRVPGTIDLPIATAVSADGGVVVGSLMTSTQWMPWRWTAGGGTELILGEWSPRGISASGTIVIGNERSPGVLHYWGPQGHELIASPAGWIATGASAVSGDGLVAVGTFTTQGFGHYAHRWTRAGGFTMLSGEQSYAWAISHDGSVTVGSVGQRATAWTANRGQVDLRGEFLAAGMPVGTDTLSMAKGVSADGRTMAGSGSGGMWVARMPAGFGCYANCDGSTGTPALTAYDFVCFVNRYAAAEAYANCDGSSTPPVVNVSDFACFLNRYAAGCP